MAISLVEPSLAVAAAGGAEGAAAVVVALIIDAFRCHMYCGIGMERLDG